MKPKRLPASLDRLHGMPPIQYVAGEGFKDRPILERLSVLGTIKDARETKQVLLATQVA